MKNVLPQLFSKGFPMLYIRYKSQINDIFTYFYTQFL